MRCKSERIHHAGAFSYEVPLANRFISNDSRTFLTTLLDDVNLFVLNMINMLCRQKVTELALKTKYFFICTFLLLHIWHFLPMSVGKKMSNRMTQNVLNHTYYVT